MTLKIAVDIDGVLADQVAAVLREIEREYGLIYSKSDVDRAHWTFEGRGGLGGDIQIAFGSRICDAGANYPWLAKGNKESQPP